MNKCPNHRIRLHRARNQPRLLQLQRERKDYYDPLEATQKGPLDVTPWLRWFLGCLLRAVQGADATLAGMLDGFEGKLTNAEWAALGKCSADTALRDINDLLARGVMRKLDGGGAARGMSCVPNRPLADMA